MKNSDSRDGVSSAISTVLLFKLMTLVHFMFGFDLIQFVFQPIHWYPEYAVFFDQLLDSQAAAVELGTD